MSLHKIFCSFVLLLTAHAQIINVAIKDGSLNSKTKNTAFTEQTVTSDEPPLFFKRHFSLVSLDELDLSDEFEHLFTLGSENFDTQGQMKFTYLAFGVLLGGLFLFGTVSAIGWRAYTRKGGTVKLFVKAVTKGTCYLLTCRCFRRQRGADQEHQVQMEQKESLLSPAEKALADDYSDDEESQNRYVKSSGPKLSHIEEVELNTHKSNEKWFLDVINGDGPAANALFAAFQKDGGDADALASLLKGQHFTSTRTTGGGDGTMTWTGDEEKKYEEDIERDAEKLASQFNKLGTWAEMKDLNVLSRMHPNFPGEHDDFLRDEKTVKQLKYSTVKNPQYYTWDYCLVFKVGDENKKVKIVTRDKPPTGAGKTIKTVEVLPEFDYFQAETARIISTFFKAGMSLALYRSQDHKEIFCLLGADENRLISQAAQMELELELDKDKLRDRCHHLELEIAKQNLEDEIYEDIYAPFKDFKSRRDNRSELYSRFDEGVLHPDTVFRTVDRLKLTAAIISDEPVLGGAGLPLSKYCRSNKHPLLSFYPLDEMMEKEDLKQFYSWSKFLDPPLDEFRDYYGEQIALYFAFLSSYTRWLIVPAFVGAAFLIWQIAANTVDVPGISAFGVLVALWSTMFLENWRHTEARLRSRWGQQNATLNASNRAEFDGDWVVSRETGQNIEVHLTHKKLRRAIASNMSLVLFLCVVIGSIGSIFVVRKVFQTCFTFQMSMTLTAVVNTIQIQIMNFLYGKLSKHLNDFENHQTDTQYYNAMITKTFIFKFVNCYNTFLYIGIAKKFDAANGYCEGSFLQHFQKASLTDHAIINAFVHGTNTTSAAAAGLSAQGLAAVKTLDIGPDYRGDCMHELAHNLAVVFMTMIFINNFVEVLIPWLHNYQKKRKEAKHHKNAETSVEISEAERQFQLDEYESTFGDYEELAVQFGYVCLFVVAFPATPMLALLNNIVEYRVDAVKLGELVRRPIPRSAGDIGTWYSVLNVVSWLALVTNLFLIMFCSSLTKGKSAAFVLLAFIVSEHVLFFAKLLIGFIYKGEPAGVIEHKERQSFLVGKVIGR